MFDNKSVDDFIEYYKVINPQILANFTKELINAKNKVDCFLESTLPKDANTNADIFKPFYDVYNKYNIK